MVVISDGLIPTLDSSYKWIYHISYTGYIMLHLNLVLHTPATPSRVWLAPKHIKPSNLQVIANVMNQVSVISAMAKLLGS